MIGQEVNAGYLHPVEIDKDPVFAASLRGEGDCIDPVSDLLHVKGSLDRPASKQRSSKLLSSSEKGNGVLYNARLENRHLLILIHHINRHLPPSSLRRIHCEVKCEKLL